MLSFASAQHVTRKISQQTAELLNKLAKMSGSTSLSRPSSDMAAFRAHFAKARSVVVLTGAGVSAESGVPTFRGAGGFWRQWQATELASPTAFRSNPSLVWEFYHYRRELMLTKQPNSAHKAISDAEKRLKEEGRHLVVITQNIDELHYRAGSRNILELHGNLFTTRCTSCSVIEKNYDSPICPALKGKGAPDENCPDARIPEKDLPKCKKCSGLLRPHVVWFGEQLDEHVLDQTHRELSQCDLCLVVMKWYR